MRTLRFAIPVLTAFTLVSLLIPPGAARATQLPDLTVSSISNPPWSGRLGAAITGRDTVKNTGPAKAGASVTRYYLSLDAKRGAGDVRLQGSRSVGPLLPQKSSAGSAHLTIPSSAPRGSYFLLACADDTRKDAERNEGNDCRASSRKIAVAAPPASLYEGTFTGSMHESYWTWSWHGTATFAWAEQEADPFPDDYSLSSGSVEVTVSGSYPVDGGECTLSSHPTTYQFVVDPAHQLSVLQVDNINDGYRVRGLQPVDAGTQWWKITVTLTCPESTNTYQWDVLADDGPSFVPTGSDYLHVSSPDGSLEGSSTAYSTSQRSYQFDWDFARIP